jgi:hypothetical protein
MTMYYVAEGTITKPSSDVLFYWQYDQAAADAISDATADLYVADEQQYSNDRNVIYWRVYFTDEAQRESYRTVVNAPSPMIESRKAYESSVGIHRTVVEIGYVDIEQPHKKPD